MAFSLKISGVKSSLLFLGKGPQLYAQKIVTRNLLRLQMLLWCMRTKQKNTFEAATTIFWSRGAFWQIFVRLKSIGLKKSAESSREIPGGYL